MLKSVSACDIVKERPGFGQTVRPVAGSVVASPVLAVLRPGPRLLLSLVPRFRDRHRRRASALRDRRPRRGSAARTSPISCASACRSEMLDGRALTASAQWRENVTPEFVQYLRGEELAAVSGDAVFADTRVNPDGTLDMLRWTRPQHDGSRCARSPCCAGCARSPPSSSRRRQCGDAGRRGASAAHRPRVHRGPLARAVVRHLGGGARPPLLHAARRGRGAPPRRRLAPSSRRGRRRSRVARRRAARCSIGSIGSGSTMQAITDHASCRPARLRRKCSTSR